MKQTVDVDERQLLFDMVKKLSEETFVHIIRCTIQQADDPHLIKELMLKELNMIK